MRTLGALALTLVLVFSVAGCMNSNTIAIVSPARLFQDSASGKAGLAHLKNMENSMQEQLAAAQKLLEQKPSDEAMRTRFQQEFSGYQALVTAEQQKVVEGINQQMQSAIESVRKEKGYTVVLTNETVLAFEPETDVTEAVLTVMDQAPISFAPVQLKPLENDAAAKPAEKPADKPVEAPAADKSAGKKPAEEKPAQKNK